MKGIGLRVKNVGLTDAKKSSKSWFTQIRDISLQYRLPHPLVILDNPPTKESYKKMVKSHILGKISYVVRIQCCHLWNIANLAL